MWAKAHTKGGRAMDDKGKKEGHQHLADSTIGKLMLEPERRSRVEGEAAAGKRSLGRVG